MADKLIQEFLGERVIQGIAEFARADIKQPDALEADEFAHVSDLALRRRLAEVFYGARWIYKLGLVVLVRENERAAHVRAQVVDYASIVEGLLGDSLAHAIKAGHARGTGYQWRDPHNRKSPIVWSPATLQDTLEKQTFWWRIMIARDFRIIDAGLERDLQWLRTRRNTVHIRGATAVGRTAFLDQSKRSFDAVMATARRTRAWRTSHP